MDVAFGVLLVAGFAAICWVFIATLRMDRRDNRAALERLDRRMRSLMFRRCQIYRDLIGHAAAIDHARREADRREGTL